MKTYLFVVCCLIVLSNWLFAQIEPVCATVPPPGETIIPTETHGIYLPAQGDLKILVVFARFKDDTAPHYDWPVGSNPNGYTTWIDPTIQTASTNLENFTHYFKTMSLGTFRVTGVAVSVETPNNRSYYGSNPYYLANKEVLQQKVDPLVNFADFDNWDFNSTYNHTNQPDGTVDMIVMIWRSSPFSGNWGGEASLGYTNSYTVENGTKTIKVGFGGNAGSGATVNYPNNGSRKYTFCSAIHEIAHWLLGGSHPYQQNSDPIYGFWGMLNNSYVMAMCANSYERERLGWITPITVTAGNKSLTDFITTGVAYKYHPPAGETNEYYYVENHQKLSIYDDATTNVNDKGIFILHQRDIYNGTHNIRVKPQDGSWNWQNPYDNTTCFPPQNIGVFKKQSVNRGTTGTSIRDKLLNSSSALVWPHAYLGQTGPEICNVFFRGTEPFYSAFNPTINNVFSRYSNPAVHTWANSPVDFAMEALSQTGNTVTVKFYIGDPATAPPSKPQFPSAVYNSNNQINVAWAANIEPDVTSGGGYDVYRAVYWDGGALSYSKRNSSLLTGTSYVDDPTPPGGIPNDKDVYYRYHVKAKDSQALTSSPSEDGWLYMGKSVSGSVAANTTWSQDRFVTSNASINSGVTVTVNAGVTVRSVPSATLTVNGTFNAVGTSSQHITFTKSSTSNWQGIVLNNANGSSLQYCDINYATIPIKSTNTSNLTVSNVTIGNSSFLNGTDDAAMAFYNSSPTITNVTINGLPGSMNGVRFAQGSTGSITGGTIQNLGNGNGIVVQGNSSPTINGITIQNNKYHGIVLNTNGSGYPIIKNCILESNGIVNGVRTYTGIRVYNGSYARLANNTIRHSNYGIYAEYNSSVIAGETQGNNGFNLITENNMGLVAYSLSTAIFGFYDQGTGVFTEACNKLYNNVDRNVLANQNCNLLVQAAWWGAAPPDTSKIVAVNNSAIDYSNWRPYDDNECSSGPEPRMMFSVKDGDGRENDEALLKEAFTARLRKDYESSKSLYQSILTESSDTDMRKQALAGLYSVFRETGDRSLISTVSANRDEMQGVGVLASELLSLMHASVSEYEEAKQIANELRARYPDSETEQRSLFLLASLAGFSESQRSVSNQALVELQRKYGSSVDEGLLVSLGGVNAEEISDRTQETATGEEALLSNYPNPFNPSTQLRYSIKDAGYVSLKVYDLLGREVAVLVNEEKQPGAYSVEWNASHLPSGMYFSRLESGGRAIIQKLLLVR